MASVLTEGSWRGGCANILCEAPISHLHPAPPFESLIHSPFPWAMTLARLTLSVLDKSASLPPLLSLQSQGPRRVIYSQLSRMSTFPGANRLSGKTVVITGASSGIGRSTAFEFARASPKGLKLVLAARRADTLRSIADQIKKEVGEQVEVLPVQLDVSNSEEVKNFVPGLPEDFRDIDILVNNA